jgi:DNA-binding transcriptional ArsR family regulator
MSDEMMRLHHNQQRMKILRALLKHPAGGVGQEILFEDLFDALDLMHASMVPDQLDFHLRVMEDWNWVELRRGNTERRANAILGITLTAAGLDRIDIGKMPDLAETQGLKRREK